MRVILYFIATLAIIFSSILPTLQAKTIWADGVSLEEGWVDINKSVEGKEWKNSTEASMCYAIAAANLITWWQSKYEIANNTPNSAKDIWNTYLKYAVPGGGSTHYALQWWFSGQYYSPSFVGSSVKLINDRADLYYNEHAVSSSLNQLVCFKGAQSLIDASCAQGGINDTIVKSLKNGIGLAIGLSGKFSHTVTLWGVEVDDETQKITKIWLTDSDDAREDLGNYPQPTIFSVDVITTTKRINNKRIETFELVGNDGNRGYKGVYISSLYGLDSSITDNAIWVLNRKSGNSTKYHSSKQ